MEHVIPVSFPTRVRRCTRDDLEELEWFGLFTEHRRIIRSAFRSQLRGEGIMLVAEGNDHLVGQVWIDLKRSARHGAGFMWALRVIPWLQGMGIGSALLDAAEQEISSCGIPFAEVSVDTENGSARAFYESRGYVFAGLGDPCMVLDSTGRKRRQYRWVFRKNLCADRIRPRMREAEASAA